MRYTVTEEIKSQVKVFKYIYIQDFFFLIIFSAVCYFMADYVAKVLTVPYIIFCAASAIFLVAPSVTNVKRRNWQAAIIYFRSDSSVYAVNENVSQRDLILEARPDCSEGE